MRDSAKKRKISFLEPSTAYQDLLGDIAAFDYCAVVENIFIHDRYLESVNK